MSFIVVLSLAFALLNVEATDSPDSRVVNGEVVNPPNSFPWQLSLQQGTFHICGAVVYDSNFVLTAAHCVGGTASNYRVACGAHDIYASEPDRQTVQVDAIVRHPSYNPNAAGFPNDIAVLRLASPLTLNSKCQAATLDTGRNFDNNPAIITGWGRLYGEGTRPRRLKRGDVEALSDNTCRGYWGNVFNPVYHVCVKDLGDKYFAACQGDSGGPAQVDGTVIGLASFVAKGCLTHFPSVYVRVSSYLSWVQSTVASMR